MNHNIYFDFYIDAPKQTVFEAFCLPEHLDHWWTLKSSGQPELGAIYNLNFTDQYNWFAEVTKVKTNTYFYLSMTEADANWKPTTFGITLEDHQNKTLLKFSHTNWPEQNHHFRFSAFCWSQLLLGLKNYIEKGVIIPFENRN
ncbi:SRPBCC family protein [Psychroserpens sp. SPM9]|uniref:SRPBCC family protein n=1 Tax=Psychroserpens sp. SPM9 TaxID=2975598 RepID=UPI0021A4FEC8|nr:SRPBCC family protein [Psychroserpens sp. SPM9]MDG5492044.1 SRPBCC family protein [Psychroserpens sp. SPM9]